MAHTGILIMKTQIACLNTPDNEGCIILNKDIQRLQMIFGYIWMFYFGYMLIHRSYYLSRSICIWLREKNAQQMTDREFLIKIKNILSQHIETSGLLLNKYHIANKINNLTGNISGDFKKKIYWSGLKPRLTALLEDVVEPRYNLRIRRY